METSSSNTRHLRARYGAEKRHRPDSDFSEIRRDLAASRIADYIARVIAEAPPLTLEQRDRIASLLRSSEVAA